MRRVFITGVTGFTGAHLAKRLVEKGVEVVGLARDPKPVTTLSLLGVKDKITLIYGDVCNESLLRRILADYEIDSVFHFAAITIVKRAPKMPVETFKVNCIGTATLLNACRQVEGIERILVPSTDKVYWEGMNKKESDALEAKGIYESSKIAQEAVARAFAFTYDMPIVITRACNIFGEYDLNPRIVPNTIRALKSGKSPIIFRNYPGIREYIYIDDVLDAYLFLMERIEKVKGEVFNIGTGETKGQEEIVLKLIEISGLDIKPRYVEPPNLKEIRAQSMDSSKIRELGWKPKYSVEEGLRLTWERWK